MSWQYRKINLNELPRRRDEIDVLCDAGEHEWELVTILPNNIAYLKRERLDDGPFVATSPAENEPERTSEVKAKYRDPATGETWSGRGRMATWLKKKQDAGEDIEKYRV
jgi:H-NS histone family